MVVRSWDGSTTQDNADKYVRHITESVIPELESLKGFVGIYVLKCPTVGGYDFRVLTMWDSMESVHAFAGEDAEKAVVAAEARTVLSAFDDKVSHYDVVIAPN